MNKSKYYFKRLKELANAKNKRRRRRNNIPVRIAIEQPQVTQTVAGETYFLLRINNANQLPQQLRVYQGRNEAGG